MRDRGRPAQLDHLRAIRKELGVLKDGQRDIKDEIISLRKQVHAFQGDSLRRDQTMAALDLNVDRINTRLELNDA